MEGCAFAVLKEIPQEELAGILLIGKENINNGHLNLKNRVDLIGELSNKMELSNRVEFSNSNSVNS
jgi:hypothetical protein